MKKTLSLIALVAIVSTAPSAFAEDKKDTKAAPAAAGYGPSSSPKYNFHLNPLGILFGVANLNFDFAITDNVALSVGGSYMKYTFLTTSINTFGVTVGADIFPSHDVFTTGLFVRPEVGFAFASSGGVSTSGLTIGANVGYWWFWDGGFNLGLGGGLSYYAVNYGALVSGGASSSIGPTIMTNIGYAF